MNDLTRGLVRRATFNNRGLAYKSESNSDHLYSFQEIVEVFHWEHIMARFAPDFQQSIYGQLAEMVPDAFEEGENDALHIRDYIGVVYELEVTVSHALCSILVQAASMSESLRLDDWGDYHLELLNPSDELLEREFSVEVEYAIQYYGLFSGCTEVMAVSALSDTFGMEIPIDAILGYAKNKIQAENTLGLPMFQEKGAKEK